ncbi:hypothetical protein ACFYST_16320 [Kitasatospora sp. NPDC004614]|uniref:hypothetical protein n=1 Tax=unclassified Kitasatospora TaxID=2633591 RepID=UPI003677FBE1
MTDEEALAWWETLPADVREQVDGLVLQFRLVWAMKILLDAGRVSHGIGLHQAQAIVGARCEHYGDRVANPANVPLDPAAVERRAGEVDERVLAVEAVWDGDTVQNWFVDLVAVGGSRDHRLVTVYWSNAARYLGSDDRIDGRPHIAVAAERIGRGVAAELGVPFHFGSPDRPDDEAPRWVRPRATP